MDNKKSGISVLAAGIIKENPVLVLILGTCPSLAVSTMAVNGIGMGIAATVVLVGSNAVISLFKNVIPDAVRIPCYIIIIAGFVSIVQMLVKAYAPTLDASLGIFLPLIVVNCIILGRAEMFANKNSVWHSMLDGLGMGIGFTLALFLIGSIREILGFGTWMAGSRDLFGVDLTGHINLGGVDPALFFILAPGGFFIYGCTIAAVNILTKGKGVKRKSFGCEDCPTAESCVIAQDGSGLCEGEGE